MNRRVFSFELNGNTVLGFDTGLGARAFAQAKMSRLIAQPGYIIFPDGKTETWRPGGVTELEVQGRRTMIIWGPNFPGEELTGLLNESGRNPPPGPEASRMLVSAVPLRKDEALDALRFWIRAAMVLEENPAGREEAPFPGPSGAYIVSGEKEEAYPYGAVFFPPGRLLKRTLEAGGDETIAEAERWIHPDLEAGNGITFSAGAMLYRIFSGASPFPGDSPAELRQNIREAVFIPPDLAAPGIDPDLAALISRSLSGVSRNKEEKNRPPPGYISGFIGTPGSKSTSSWVRPLNEEELAKIRTEHEQYIKRKTFRVKTRRFVIRNTAIITGVAIALVVLGLMARDFIQGRANLPSTKGMNPTGVAEAYYGAFDILDHTMMEACVSGKAGKRDIEMVMNFYVISRVRQAYERIEGFMPAREWLEAGRPDTDALIFGITDLSVKVLSRTNEQAALEANYTLWIPGSYVSESQDNSPGEEVPPAAGTLSRRDILNMVFQKGAWQIAEIIRNE